MKKFLLKIFLFQTFIILGAYLLDYSISCGLRQMKDYRFQSWKEIQSGTIKADLVIMGNSRGLSHFVPSVIESVTGLKSYNISIGGHPFNVEIDKYRFYREHNVKPKVLVINVDFLTLSSPAILGHEREQVFPYIYDDTLKSVLPSLGFTYSELYLPAFRYFGYQKVIKDGLMEYVGLKHIVNSESEQGFLAEEGSWNPTELNAIKVIKWKFDPKVLHTFEQLLMQCKRENIQVFLVNSPIYYKAVKKVENENLLHQYFKRVSKRYGSEYLDYTKNTISNDSNNFVVAVHLNKKAAYFFSQMFARDIKQKIRS